MPPVLSLFVLGYDLFIMTHVTLASALQTARIHSSYVADHLDRDPLLIADADLLPLDRQKLHDDCTQAHQIEDEQGFRRAIRLIRHHHMVRIAVRDFAAIAPLEETLADTSHVADALIIASYRWAFAKLAKTWGTPIGFHTRAPQEMIILGMGKLGGYELNFSSDIDLIFVFPEDGETEGGERSIANEEFFIKLGQLMNSALTAVTDLGFVYRVDMRLRPFGTAGQLAQSFDSIEYYYQTHGRPWERHAMVKARAITGNPKDIAQLQALLIPFVYRHYVDFSMLDSLRDLKRMIADDLNRKGSTTDLKLGAGGIRDIEFIVQAFQLIHGGRDVTLRGRSLIPMLKALGERHYLERAVADDLLQAYKFLRRVENHVQMWEDQRTHSLPEDQTQLDILAQGFDVKNTPDFLSRLNSVRTRVAAHFDAVFQETLPTVPSGWEDVWNDPRQGTPPRATDDESQWREHLAAFKQGRRFLTQTSEDRDRLDAVMPLILDDIDTVETLKRVLQVLDSVLRRSVYLVLLKASPPARKTLIKLCASSPWLTDTLTATPALLDQLLDPKQLFSLFNRAQLSAEIQEQLGSAPDDEHLMNVIRRVKQANVFKVAASDLMNGLPLMKVSDNLTWIAEAVVDVTLDHVWRMALARHGRPGGWTQDTPPFLVIGFGKLGGLELGYGSDLDMVFLSHDDLPPSLMSDGPHPLEGAIYVTRMGQKLITTLSTVMASGVAYEVDSRLRPHGASGLLLNSLDGFFKYEQEQAWVWEHQALIRTRAIAGHPQMQKSFEEQRKNFLCQPRDATTLRQQVLTMRQKMQTHLDESTAEEFDIKQGSGGIIDLEFLVQYLILRHANAHPDLATFSDNIRQLESLTQTGILSDQERDGLTQAYLGLRSLAHKAALSKTDAMAAPAQVKPWREAVQSAWERYLS